MDPYEKLCYHDPRNPMLPQDNENPPEPRNGCCCDNCFYGRDALALEIIRLRNALHRIWSQTPEEHLACLDRRIAAETLKQ